MDIHEGDTIEWERSSFDGRVRTTHSGTVEYVNEWDVGVKSFDFETIIEVNLTAITKINNQEV